MMTWVEVDKRAIEHNIKQFRKLIGKDRFLMPVIKANAYGHGFLNIARICEESSEVDRVCVVNSDEALELVKLGYKKTIQILSFYELEDAIIATLVDSGVRFPLYTIEQAKCLDSIAGRLNKLAYVHLKIDTGTTRVGVLPKDVESFIKQLARFKNINVEGLWSHFASSETDLNYTKKQYKTFFEVAELLKKQAIEPPIRHMSCTAASTVYKLDGFNAMRLGIGLYGLHPTSKTQSKISLKPALSLNTKIIQVKKVQKGVKIGYGGTYTTTEDCKIAILPVGYWDGYDRKLSNVGQVLIKGKKCPIRGRICMNLCMVDVSKINNVKVGDRVTLIGKQGNQHIATEDLAKWIGTINYEVVDRINPLLPRILI